MLDHRARLLRATVGFVLVPPTEPEFRLLHRWLDSWRGIGDIVAGMARQECDHELADITSSSSNAREVVACGLCARLPPANGAGCTVLAISSPGRTP